MKLISNNEAPLADSVEVKQAWRKLARRIAPSVLEIPLLFDDDNARKVGEELCDRLLVHLCPRYAIHLLTWKLTVTQFPTLAEIVVREAMRTPFVLVTVNGAKAVSPEVEAFIRRCAAAMYRGGAALVVQLCGIAKDEMESSPAYRCLKQISEDAKIPIFSTVVELNHQSRGAGRASPRRNASPFVAIPPQTLPLAS